MAKDMLYSHLRLIQSALGQKVEAEPVGNHRGRSQGRAAMGGHEVASFPGEAGLPLGQSRIERASPYRAKFDQSASLATGRDAAQAVSGRPTALVSPAATPSTQHVRFTDEVPRRPGLQGWVSLGYKSRTKGPGDASETGTAFPRPRLKGCQQRQSRGLRQGRFSAPIACSERQTLRVPSEPLRFMGPVSPVDKATQWPGGTSSSQSTGPLSNSPQQPKPGQTAVRPR
jgi:hypothetical protein